MNTQRYTVRRTPYGGWGLYDSYNQTYVMFGEDWDMKQEARKLNTAEDRAAARRKRRKEVCHA